ncbi:MAG: hypothetical protein MI674_05410, partial [Cytophagales bacterium]|nr:hypothetical protein [Cytophagales bacterium]
MCKSPLDDMKLFLKYIYPSLVNIKYSLAEINPSLVNIKSSLPMIKSSLSIINSSSEEIKGPSYNIKFSLQEANSSPEEIDSSLKEINSSLLRINSSFPRIASYLESLEGVASSLEEINSSFENWEEIESFLENLGGVASSLEMIKSSSERLRKIRFSLRTKEPSLREIHSSLLRIAPCLESLEGIASSLEMSKPSLESLEGIASSLRGIKSSLREIKFSLREIEPSLEEVKSSLESLEKIAQALEIEADRVWQQELEEELQSITARFLCDYPKKLPLPDRQKFRQTIGPILKTKLPKAASSLQHAVVQYFENGGSFYPVILQNCDVADWIKESLVLDITQGALANGNEGVLEFQEQWQAVSRTYEDPEVEKLLWALKEKQHTHSLDLLAICEVLEFLPADSKKALNLLHSQDHAWLPALKSAWLQPRLQALTHTFSAIELSQLSNAIAHLAWNAELITHFLAGMEAEKDFSTIKNFLTWVANPTIPKTALLTAFQSEPLYQGASVVKEWTHSIACFLLTTKLEKLFPDHVPPIQQQLAALLRYPCSYESLDALLEALLRKKARGPPTASCAQQLKEALDILCEYRLEEAACTRAFKVFKEYPSEDWIEEIHQLAISNTFQSSHQRSVEEIVEWIATKSPEAFFASDSKALQRSYQAVMAAYNTPSKVLKLVSKVPESASEVLESAAKPISHWEKADIKRWATCVKEQAENPTTPPVTQQEMVAVIKRAVELHNGFSPRATQLLAVLSLLNPTSHTGRLAQVNTGEGKSAIVAMLAAIHALQGKKVDVVTSSTELSIPEVKKQTDFFALFDLTVGENSNYFAKRNVYQRAIVYGTAGEFQGDILRDEFSGENFRGDRGFGVVLVDEVDDMLFDKRAYRILLASQMPAMNHLEIVLATVWSQVNTMARHLIEKEGQTFCVTEDFQVDGEKITLFSDNDLCDCLLPVDDKESFIKAKTQEHLENLLRKLSPEERAAWQKYRTFNARLSKLSQEIGNLDQEIANLDQEIADLDQEIADLSQEIAKKRQEKYKRAHSIFGLCPEIANLSQETYKSPFIATREERKKRQKEEEKRQKEEERGQKAEAKRQKEEECKQLAHQSQEAWGQKYPILEIPNHLREFALQQIPYWIQSALHAQFLYQKEVHYDVQEGEIVPIDYANTGVLQNNMVWSDGLAQFLQIKEGLKITPERVSTNYLSSVGFFKRYGSSIYGLTGTLGNPTTQSFFKEMYGTDLVFIPPYKHSVIVGNERSPYFCKELPALVVPTKEGWYQAICETVLSKARNDRAVLVICQHINQVKHLSQQLQEQYEADRVLGPDKIFTYTGQEPFTKTIVGARQVIIATNIAGRGTDLTPTDWVEQNGGMHVCLTFLPKNYRVELQNAGRTARQGRRGSAQLVLHDPSSSSITALKALRDAKEAAEITSAKKDVTKILFQDRLFNQFSDLVAYLPPQMHKCEKIQEIERLEKAWEAHVQEALAADRVSAAFKAHLAAESQKMLDNVLETYWKDSSEAERAKARPTLEKAIRDSVIPQKVKKEDFLPQYKADVVDQFCQAWQGEVSSEVLEYFRAINPFMPKGEKLGRHEKAAAEERWGFWLAKVLREQTLEDEQAVLAQFKAFATDIISDAQSDQLVQNPYFYIQKGNECVAKGDYTAAVRWYDKAIARDSDFSVNAHYNKARALLLGDDKGNQEIAKRELQAAKDLLETFYKPTLLSFHALVSQTGEGALLSEHVQHQLDILTQQENHIEAAIQVINGAQHNGRGVELSDKSLEAVFHDAERDHQPAIDESRVNGLSHLFTLTERPPKRPWWQAWVVAVLGVVQVAAGVLITACTAGTFGTGLIKEGVSDIITAVKSAFGGKFSWEEWKLQKAIRLAICIVSAGWDLVKKGIKTIGESIKQGVKEVGRTVRNLGSLGSELGIKGLEAAKKQVGLAFGKGLLKEGLTAIVNYGVDH